MLNQRLTDIQRGNEKIELNFLLTKDLLLKLFSPSTLQKILTQDTLNRIQPLLPNIQDKSPQSISNLLCKENAKFGTPIDHFLSMYNSGFFLESYQKIIPYFRAACLNEYLSNYRKVLKTLEKKLSDLKPSSDNLITFDMHSSLASCGYSSADSNKDGNNNENDNSGNLIEVGVPNKKKITQSVSQNTEGKNDAHNDRFKMLKKCKNIVTIKKRTPEEVQDFRKQEVERYKHPLLPWEYRLPNGTRAIVAPLIKKSKAVMSAKARDHAFLKQDRPSYITILSLVRDAASKLEDGVGTRADICDLLKDSQYVNENLVDGQVNNIVSGALDRLHYEEDACVRYDQHKKLWVYLHRNRTLNDFKLQNDPNKKIYDSLKDNENVAVDEGSIIIRKSAVTGYDGELGKKRGIDDYIDENSKPKKKQKIS